MTSFSSSKNMKNKRHDRTMAWRRKNIAAYRLYQKMYARKWDKKNKDKRMNSRMKGMGLDFSFARYEEMHAVQGEKCAICKRPPKKGRLYIDHCHKTMKVRGLLCQQCNVGIGNFSDDISTIVDAMEYLKKNL